MDVAKIFGLPESKITYVKDRAFNDQCALTTIYLPVCSCSCCSYLYEPAHAPYPCMINNQFVLASRIVAVFCAAFCDDEQ